MIITDNALPSPDSAYLSEVHPNAEQMRGGSPYTGKARRQLTLWGRQVNDGTAFGDMWEAKVYNSTVIPVRTLPTAAETIAIISDNAADAAAGTGARTVRAFFLDLTGAEHYADFAMNGTAAVAVATAIDGGAGGAVSNCWRVQYLQVTSAGSGGANAGNISVSNSTQTYTGGVPATATLIRGYIAAGYNVSHHGFYTVPAGYKAQIKAFFLNAVDVSTTVKYAKFQMGIADSTTGLIQTVPLGGDSSNSGGSPWNPVLEMTIDALQDIRVQGLGLSAGSSELIAVVQMIVYPKV